MAEILIKESKPNSEEEEEIGGLIYAWRKQVAKKEQIDARLVEQIDRRLEEYIKRKGLLEDQIGGKEGGNQKKKRKKEEYQSNEFFGDVPFFNITYKINAYAKPLVLFVGVNNHRTTCVFGVRLLSDETVQSYIWVFNTLMNSMDHKHPISILTDRDEAMRQAIDDISQLTAQDMWMARIQ
ncbi:hypothetical protein Ddye_016665 [Dipteronia dyeriana]|uniref:MULE transposase domain-containing protein n=1 Tax=Dipteronia dyeriana TaxID=168575 RepID=A0AAD9U7T5_9ROSI|nr:hypothetical protein Ddye_016665 [Dipteronia dyeriana]